MSDKQNKQRPRASEQACRGRAFLPGPRLNPANSDRID
jgi:hypothetical protein